MKEVEAKDFDVPSIDNEHTPISVRLLPKKPDTHLSEIPSDEWSLHISSSRAVSADEWKALALACEEAGFNTSVSGSETSIAVW